MHSRHALNNGLALAALFASSNAAPALAPHIKTGKPASHYQASQQSLVSKATKKKFTEFKANLNKPAEYVHLVLDLKDILNVLQVPFDKSHLSDKPLSYWKRQAGLKSAQYQISDLKKQAKQLSQKPDFNSLHISLDSIQRDMDFGGLDISAVGTTQATIVECFRVFNWANGHYWLGRIKNSLDEFLSAKEDLFPGIDENLSRVSKGLEAAGYDLSEYKLDKDDLLVLESLSSVIESINTFKKSKKDISWLNRGAEALESAIKNIPASSANHNLLTIRTAAIDAKNQLDGMTKGQINLSSTGLEDLATTFSEAIKPVVQEMSGKLAAGLAANPKYIPHAKPKPSAGIIYWTPTF